MVVVLRGARLAQCSFVIAGLWLCSRYQGSHISETKDNALA